MVGAVYGVTAATIHTMYTGAWNTYYDYYRKKALASTQPKPVEEPETTSAWLEWLPIQKLTEEEYREHKGRLQRMEEIMKDLEEYEQKHNYRRSDMEANTFPTPPDSERSE